MQNMSNLFSGPSNQKPFIGIGKCKMIKFVGAN